VLERIENGTSVLLEIDVQGALMVKENYPDAVLVFILPPSLSVLEDRLRNRGTETEEKIRERMTQYQREFKKAPAYQYLLINDDLSVAVSDLEAILRAEQMKTVRCQDIIEEVLQK
jgi:guanylate kinase